MNLIASFIKPNRKTWVFGNSLGYRDNSRYFFEFVLLKFPDLKPVWIANNEQEMTLVESLGGTVVLRGTRKSWNVVSKAAVGVVSMGLADLSHPITNKILIVNLFHGNTLKKLGLDTKTEIEVVKGMSIINSINLFFLKKALNRYDLLITSSLLSQKRFSSAFALPFQRVPVCGQPRTDFLFNGCEKSNQMMACKNLPKRYVLYAPTWRETGDNPSSTLNLSKWNKELSKLDTTLLLKLHPLAKINTRSQSPYSHVRIVTDTDIEFTHLLYHAEVLVSDYSGAIPDFALLERPILLYTPDLEYYSNSRGLYQPLSNLGEELLFYDEGTLLNGVISALKDDSNFKNYSMKIAKHYNDFFDGKNCERTIQAIFSQLDEKNHKQNNNNVCF